MRQTIIVLAIVLGTNAAAGAYVVPVEVVNPEQMQYFTMRAYMDQVENSWMEYIHLYDVIARYGDLGWRDLLGILAGFNEAMAYGYSMAYSREGAFQYFLELFPLDFAVTPEMAAAEDFTLRTLDDKWMRHVRDTYAGAFNVLVAQSGDYQESLARLEQLRILVEGAAGENQLLEANASVNGFVAEELAKINQLLTVLINIRAVAETYPVVAKHVTENTLKGLNFPEGWDLPHNYSKWPDWRHAMATAPPQ